MLLLQHVIEQLQEAHAKLGNHPSVQLCVQARDSMGTTEYTIPSTKEVHLDAVKQTVYLPVSSRYNH
jgi:hypothetical protein